MQLLEPSFQPAASSARVVGRIHTNGHPDIEAAIDDALRTAELDVVTLDWDEMEAGALAFAAIYMAEMYEVDGALVAAHPDAVGADVVATVAASDLFRPGVDDARRSLVGWRERFFALFDQVELVALPTLPIFPPRLDEITLDSLLPAIIEITANVALFNAAGAPATAQPVPTQTGGLPASLQLVGPLGAEELLVPTAQKVEDAVSR
jgi:Asp-tRNA(Asn)/Glu-tRNA(Gln) amidotransferase A subunit family amidase